MRSSWSIAVALVSASTTGALASERSVCVEVSSSDVVIEPTVHRIGGELGAAGFDVSFPKAGERSDCDAGRIFLEVVNSTRLDIVATSGDAETKVVVSLSMDGANRNAEMFAVRAVEALRAAMLQRVRLHPNERIAEPLRAFTRDAAERERPDSPRRDAARGESFEAKAEEPSAPKEVRERRSAPPRVLLGLGPRLGFDAGEPTFLLATDLTVLWGALWIGVRGDLRLAALHFEGEQGVIDVSSYAFGAALGARIFRRERFLGYLGAKLDYRLIEMTATEPNGATTWVRHRSADPGIFGWVGYLFSQRSGVALAFDGGFLVSGPEIHLDERVVSFGRPTFSLGPELFLEF